MNKEQATERAVELLTQVGIPEPKRRLRQYPHELSGGMRQRVMIAIALAGEPELLIADEPTTALDVTVQKYILDLLGELQTDIGMAIILITHDLGVARGRTDDIMVMYGGRVMELAPSEELFSDMSHPYTQALFSAIPRVDQPKHTRLTPICGGAARSCCTSIWLPVQSSLCVRPRRLHNHAARTPMGQTSTNLRASIPLGPMHRCRRGLRTPHVATPPRASRSKPRGPANGRHW